MTALQDIVVRPVSSDADWQAARDIRIRVFVEEQDVRMDGEFDEYDASARQFVCEMDGRIIGTARWRAVRSEEGAAAKLERFAVLEEVRGRGAGHRLVEALIDDARQAGFDRFILHAQAHLQDFYGSHGFVTEGDVFLEEHIKHVLMVRDDMKEGSPGRRESLQKSKDRSS
jgi:predicted GNAT family N-acyltransferase